MQNLAHANEPRNRTPYELAPVPNSSPPLQCWLQLAQVVLGLVALCYSAMQETTEDSGHYSRLSVNSSVAAGQD